MKIDCFSHFLPTKYFERLEKKARACTDFTSLAPWLLSNAALRDLDVRFQTMDQNPEVTQVLTVPLPPLDDGLVTTDDAVELARLANDELAEIVARFPDRFVAAVACLPLSDVDAAVEEAERAITQLGLKGVQIFTSINGRSPQLAEFGPLYEKMAQLDLPIWIHPADSPRWSDVSNDHLLARLLGWPVETSIVMVQLARAGVFERYPNIKLITHHCGAMIPFFERRLGVEQLRKFYNDTAVNGNVSALMCGHAYCGADHLLFGTDMPLGGKKGSYGATLETIRSIEQMDISEKDKDSIFRENAIRLMSLAI